MSKDAKNIQNKTRVNININKDDSELNDFLYCWGEFKSRPNKIIIYNSYIKDEFINVISEYTQDKNVFTEVIPADESLIINDKMLIKVNDDLYISYLVLDRNNENSIIHEMTFFFKHYTNQLETINELLAKLDGCIFDLDIDHEHSKLNTITISQNGLDIENIEFKGIDMEDIDLYYDSDTLKRTNKLIKSIKKSEKGLSIFYGHRGTGKTSMISYIASKLDRMVLFIPNNMIESTINNPEFKNFLKKHPNPVIIIDDCEVLFNELFTRSNIFVNNMLQLIDGPLSDMIGVNIITIFNLEDDSEIDHSLLECNNLIDVIEFDLLDVNSSNDLAKHIKSRGKYKNKTKLIDIIKKRNTPNRKKVGF